MLEIDIIIRIDYGAVNYDHSESIIHRALKSDNMMVGNFEDVCVIDQEIAWDFDKDLETLQSTIDLTDLE